MSENAKIVDLNALSYYNEKLNTKINSGGNTVSGSSSYTINNAVDYPLLGLSLYGRSTQDGTPSPDNPIDIVSVGDNGSAEITACGKNLFPWNDYTKVDWSRHHLEYVTRTIYENEIELNINLPSGNAGIYIPSEYLAKPIFDRYDGMMITSSFEMKSSVPLHASACGFEGSSSSFDITTEWKRYSVSKPYNKEKNNAFTFYTMQTGEVTWNIRNIQIELGDTATEYKPYIGNTAAITSAMPLCGIPVDSVGNYTDKNGQQWVCDELVYNADGSGKIVKNAEIFVFDGSDDENWINAIVTDGFENDLRIQYAKLNGTKAESISSSFTFLLCNRLQYNNMIWNNDIPGCQLASIGDFIVRIPSSVVGGTNAAAFKSWLAGNPLIIVYQIAPQEIILTAAEMTELRQLMTYSGTTNISNSDNADMDVKYCTDKVLSEYVMPVITNMQVQIDELKSAVLSLGGNV